MFLRSLWPTRSYPSQGYGASKGMPLQPLDGLRRFLKKKRAVALAVGRYAGLAIVAAVAVLSYLFLFRQTPARLLEKALPR